MSKKILHIGLGKCASTYLQYEIFSTIAQKYSLKYFGPIDINEMTHRYETTTC